MADDDWFMQAAIEAEKSEMAARARALDEERRIAREKAAQDKAVRDAELASKLPTRQEAKAAATAFGVAVPPPTPVNDLGLPATRQVEITPDAALGVILQHIRRQGSPEKIRAASGEWITKVTVAIGDAVRAAMPDEED